MPAQDVCEAGGCTDSGGLQLFIYCKWNTVNGMQQTRDKLATVWRVTEIVQRNSVNLLPSDMFQASHVFMAEACLQLLYLLSCFHTKEPAHEWAAV